MLKILKFGGSSVATAELMQQVGDIILKHTQQEEQIVVVISALRGTTNQLLECAHLAANNMENYKTVLDQIKKRHVELSNKLISKNNKSIYDAIETLFKNLGEALQSIQYLRANYLYTYDLVASYGEQLSATIFSAYLNTRFPACYVDAREFIVTDDQFTKARVLYEESSGRIKHYFNNFFETEKKFTIAVVTGFIGMTKDKHVTTIGRDGSNYTAAILGAALKADAIEIWSDVDGVYSADPNQIKTSVVIPHLSYSEAEELSHYRAKVINSAVISQIITKNIIIRVKNTMDPTAIGTEISNVTQTKTVKNISLLHDLVIITLSPHKIKQPHLLERLLHCLAFENINFTSISQFSSSVDDISFSVNKDDIERTKNVIQVEFRYEFQQHLLIMTETRGQSVIAMVGDGIREALSTLGHVFIALEKNQIDLKGLARGTAACNISFVLNSVQSHHALEVMHRTIFGK